MYFTLEMIALALASETISINLVSFKLKFVPACLRVDGLLGVDTEGFNCAFKILSQIYVYNTISSPLGL